jgi:hypothetical protein
MRGRASVLAWVVAVALLGGCGGGEDTGTTPAQRPIPQSLRTVASAAKQTTDTVLSGDRATAVTSANVLRDAAQGAAADDLADADVPATLVAELKTRAAAVSAIVARGKPVAVALAANRVFELVPDFRAVYSDPVPSQVTRLEYLDREARLQALAGDRGRVDDAVGGLDVAWKVLRKDVVRAGGSAAARPFDAHLRAIDALVKADAGLRALGREAQHGLRLVDEIKAVYTR